VRRRQRGVHAARLPDRPAAVQRVEDGEFARPLLDRAIVNRYRDRARPGIADQTRSYACLAASTARSTSSAAPCVTSARTSSVAGEIVLKTDAPPANEPPMNSP
jgi:hypothetical protein